MKLKLLSVTKSEFVEVDGEEDGTGATTCRHKLRYTLPRDAIPSGNHDFRIASGPAGVEGGSLRVQEGRGPHAQVPLRFAIDRNTR